jgi:nitrogen fixation/metabolism regulation signal transduction histidine kinase
MANANPLGRGYHRSWKNYLLDDRYQLNFTLFMVVVTALVVTLLALFIKREVRKATTIAISDVQGKVDEGLLSEDDARSSIAYLEQRRRMVSYMLVGMDVLLAIGLTVYGIKMTHKVAGPLRKVMNYLDKVKAGKFEKVYSLRKGDQLVGFYEQFKEAHEAMRHRQELDIERLRALCAAADHAEADKKSPEMAEALKELKALLRFKEASLG